MKIGEIGSKQLCSDEGENEKHEGNLDLRETFKVIKNKRVYT